MNDEALLPHIGRCLPVGFRELGIEATIGRKLFSLRRNRDGAFTVYYSQRLSYPAATLEFALEVLESYVELHVAKNARDSVFIHAGAVEYEGAGIVIPGDSLSGKSSLVLALVRLGAAYYSDEYAVLDRNGRLYPYARPPYTRNDSGESRTMHPLQTLGRIGVEPVPVRLVVSTSHEANGCWKPRVMAQAETLLALLAHAIPARRRPAAVLDALHAAITGASGLSSPRGEALQTAPLLLEALDRDKSAGRSEVGQRRRTSGCS